MKGKYTMRKFNADFETTVFEGQTNTEVWASAFIDLDAECSPENVVIDNNIEDFFDHLFEIEDNSAIWFHNLKWDGNFIINKCINELSLYTDDEGNMKQFDQGMPRDGYYTYMVSDFGEWYSITISRNGFYYTFRDSAKLIPFSVEEIGDAFDTKYRKLEIDYTDHKHANEYITKQEKDYICCDVLVMHEALNRMFEKGFTRSTIGSCCMEEFKELNPYGKMGYAKIFQDFTKWESRVPGFESVDEYLRKAYHGGWCYVNPKIANKVITKPGCHVDKNSMYPSKMHSISGCRYPVGRPTFFTGNIPEEAKSDIKYYFVRFRCAFDLKKNMLPTVQIKGDPKYSPTEWLTTSSYNGNQYVVDIDGSVKYIRPEMVMTQTDFEMFLEHYNVKMLEILDGCYFDTTIGLFDQYIDKYMTMKINAKNKVERTIAKLALNNLSGRMGARKDANFKEYKSEDGLRCSAYHTGFKKAGTISIAAAITSYARRDCIKAAQANYKHFLYSDTDSMALSCTPDEVKGIVMDDKALDCWKVETEFDQAVFVRQKCYLEHVTAEDLKPVDPYFNIKCAGLGKGGKGYLKKNLDSGLLTINDFRSGLVIKENLRSTTIEGGLVLQETQFIL